MNIENLKKVALEMSGPDPDIGFFEEEGLWGLNGPGFTLDVYQEEECELLFEELEVRVAKGEKLSIKGSLLAGEFSLAQKLLTALMGEKEAAKLLEDLKLPEPTAQEELILELLSDL